MNKEDCIFCKIATGQMGCVTIFENSEFKVILDRFPGTKGHTLIIPKEHVENIFDLDPEVGGRLFQLAIQISKILKRELNAEGINIVQNNGKIAGQTVFHFHLHLIPRYENDGVTIKWNAMEPTEEELCSISDKITAALK